MSRPDEISFAALIMPFLGASYARGAFDAAIKPTSEIVFKV
jgi:hypothetical protein